MTYRVTLTAVFEITADDGHGAVVRAFEVAKRRQWGRGDVSRVSALVQQPPLEHPLKPEEWWPPDPAPTEEPADGH